MTDQGPLAAKWAESARAFNDGAGDAFDSLFALDCVWNSPQGQIEGSAVIQAALNERHGVIPPFTIYVDR